jgi:hypothetical protein
MGATATDGPIFFQSGPVWSLVFFQSYRPDLATLASPECHTNNSPTKGTHNQNTGTVVLFATLAVSHQPAQPSSSAIFTASEIFAPASSPICDHFCHPHWTYLHPEILDSDGELRDILYSSFKLASSPPSTLSSPGNALTNVHLVKAQWASGHITGERGCEAQVWPTARLVQVLSSCSTWLASWGLRVLAKDKVGFTRREGNDISSSQARRIGVLSLERLRWGGATILSGQDRRQVVSLWTPQRWSVVRSSRRNLH